MTALSVLCAALVTTGPAQGATPQVGVVNIAQLFDQYQMTADLEQMFGERRRGAAGDAQKRRDDIEGQKRTLIERFKPDTPDFAQREEQIIHAEVEFQAWMEIQERKLKRQHMLSLLSIYRDIESTVAEIASERGLDLVLTVDEVPEQAPDSQTLKQQILLKQVIYASGRVNVTAEVLRRINAAYERRGGANSLPKNAIGMSSLSFAPVAQQDKK